jgi:putative RecB family exonuclease
MQAGSLSPSRASDFMQCALLYRFRAIDRLPEPPSSAAVRGTLVHTVLERLFDAPGPDRTVDMALAQVPDAWTTLRQEDPAIEALLASEGIDDESWLASIGRLVHAYFTLEDPTTFDPEGRELLVEWKVDEELMLRGYIDRIDRAPDGQVRVVDYKTGKAPRAGFETKAMFQMRFYALLLWRTTGQVPTLLQLLYLGSGEALRYSPDEADLVATERKVRALWSAITAATAARDFRPSPSALCGWCSHKPLCPAFGGTPPEFPELPPPRTARE